MTARRALGILLVAVAAGAAIVLMVGYTRRVETNLRKGPVATTSVRLLKDRAAIAPLTGIDLDGHPVNTAALRGKVVLVNFWYPSCGPCRGEFPTLQRVLTKYQDRGFVILALNVYPDEDEFVMPYMTNNHFTFRPLKTDTDWAEKNYAARGYPTNALVDAAGRVIFKPGVVRGELEQRTLELQVEMLLAHR